MSHVLLPEEKPDIDNLMIEDGKPGENTFAEKQQRLLTEPLYSSWAGPGEGRTFLALANVGLFFAPKEPPLSPDVILSLDVPMARELTQKQNRSYLIWEMGKPPDVVIEFVSDKRGGEGSYKRREYARIRVLYYAIFDPQDRLGEGVLRLFELRRGVYVPLEQPVFPGVGLGLVLWQGDYEGQPECWLRWSDEKGECIPTGRERADAAEQRAEKAQQQADSLRAQLRALGVEPTE
jgi:Uma2 family endonuclease